MSKCSQVCTYTVLMINACVYFKVNKKQNVHKYLPVLNVCACFWNRFTNASVHKIVYIHVLATQCMCMLLEMVHKCQNVHKYLPVLVMYVYASGKGSQMPKCSQMSAVYSYILNVCVCFWKKVHKCQNVHKYLPVLNVCVCFWKRFTNAKMFTNVYSI